MTNLVTTDLKVVLVVKDLVAKTLVDLVEVDLKTSSVHSCGSRQRDPNAPRKGDDLQYTMTLEFEEAVFGTKKKSQSVKM